MPTHVKQRGTKQTDHTVPDLRWNIRSKAHDIVNIADEFLQNSRLANQRKNGVLIYHEVISFSPEENEKISDVMLLDVAEEYLKLRAPAALAYAKVHRDTENPHVHIVISSNNKQSRQKIRISKTEFRNIKQEMERPGTRIPRPGKVPEQSYSEPYERNTERNTESNTGRGGTSPPDAQDP